MARYSEEFKTVTVRKALIADGPGAATFAEEAADSIGAKAFAQGSDIVFAKDQYNPGTAEGRGLIGHELAHVAQSATGVHRAPKKDEENTEAKKEAKETPWYQGLGEKVVEYTLDGLIQIVENIPIVLFGPFPFIATLPFKLYGFGKQSFVFSTDGMPKCPGGMLII